MMEGWIRGLIAFCFYFETTEWLEDSNGAKDEHSSGEVVRNKSRRLAYCLSVGHTVGL